MTTRAAFAALILVAGNGLPHLAGATSCEVLTGFDPHSTTVVVAGHSFVGDSCVFRSPENTDPTLVWHVGDPGTLDGCVGGIAPGSGAPTGQLELRIGDLWCFAVDVETTTPYTAELFDPSGVLVSVDNMRTVLIGTPVRARTWGTVKTIYR